MTSLPIDDADGSEPLPVCRAHREWLVNRYKLDAAIALRYFSDDQPVDGKHSFASFCPWCGAKLPDRPFAEADDA